MTPGPRVEIICWISESKWPFEIVNDRGFHSLMKTGRPEYRLPSPSTVSQNVKSVFLNVRKRIAKTLQVGISSYCSTPTENSPGLTRNIRKRGFSFSQLLLPFAFLFILFPPFSSLLLTPFANFCRKGWKVYQRLQKA